MGDRKRNTISKQKPLTNTKKDTAKALCCTARESSTDSLNGSELQTRYIDSHQHDQEGAQRADNGHVSLTPSDVYELRSIVPTPRTSGSADQLDDGSNSTASTPTSVAKLLKKKLSKLSSSPKKSSPKKERAAKVTPKKSTLKSPMSITPSGATDPLVCAYDSDAQLIAQDDIIGHIKEQAEQTATRQQRRAKRGNIRSEESAKVPLISQSEHHGPEGSSKRARKSTSSLINAYEEDYVISAPVRSPSHRSGQSKDKENGPLIARQHDLKNDPANISAIRDDCTTTGVEELRHGKLSFEDNEVNVGTNVAARASALALAVDSLFNGSSEYSERSPAEESRSREAQRGINIFKTDLSKPDQSQVFTKEHGFAPLNRTVFYQGSSEYSVRDQPASISSRYAEPFSAHASGPTTASRPTSAMPRSVVQRLEDSTPQRHPSDSSVHLQNMRISQHLRSFSSLSEDSASAETFGSDLSARAITYNAQLEQLHRGCKHRRSHSSFQSVHVPETWGIVTQPAATQSASGGLAEAQSDYSGLVKRSLDEPRPNGAIDKEADPRAGILKLDGLVDSYENQPDASLAPPTLSSGRSIGSNYDETTSMWEKAFAAHQDQTQEASRKRGSSFSSTGRRSSKKDKQSSEGSRVPSIAILESDSPLEDHELKPFLLKRVNTSFSFDHLSIPNRPSVGQSGTPSASDEQDRRPSNRLNPSGRGRSVSSPPAHEEATLQDRNAFGPLLVVPGANSDQLSIPSITLSEPVRDSISIGPSIVLGPFDDLDPTERPWARYPSHTREARNGPASEATGDNVKIIDYQPIVEPATRSEASSDRQKRREKIKFRAMTIVLKRKLLTDLPAAFKSQEGTYRRRQHGHRSSISAGGKVEYPELELMPSSAPRLPTAIDAEAIYGPSLARKIEKRSLERRPTMSSGSGSYYGSSEGLTPIQSESGSVKRAVDLLASDYHQHISERGRLKSEAVSPLDGVSTDKAKPSFSSPGSRSLPDRRLRPVVKDGAVLLTRFNSHQELRSSTHDLLERFKADETKNRHSALIAAEGEWLD